MTPAGGLRYHLSAFRYRTSLWAPFRREVEQWLASWRCPKNLILIGPSGGYCLPPDWLQRFESIVILEPDPVARAVFRRRVRLASGSAGIVWEKRKCLKFTRRHLDLESFTELLSRYSEHAVLFSNLLGQLRFSHPEGDDFLPEADWLRPLEEALQGREWASFHDLYSYDGEEVPLPAGRHWIEPGEPVEPLISEFGRALPAGSRLELLDHGTLHLGEAFSRQLFHWQIRPGQHHWVAACRSGSSNPRIST